MQAGLAGSRGGQFFAAQASDAIPIGLTSAQYQNIYQQIQLSSQNATQAINGEVQNLLGTSGTSASSVAGTIPTTTSQQTNTNTNDPLGLGL